MNPLASLFSLALLLTGLFPASARATSDDLIGRRVEPAGWHLDGRPLAQAQVLGWSAVDGTPNQSAEMVAVRANGDVYAVGEFSEIGGVSTAPQYMVARYDGTSWTALGGANDWIFSLLVEDDGTVFVGGRFTQIGGVAASRIAYFNATSSTWHALGVGFNNPVEVIAHGPDGCIYAGGTFRIIGDNTGLGLARTCVEEVWEYVGGGTNNTVLDLAFDGQTMYVGGSFTQVGGVAANQIAQYDLDTGVWAPVGGGVTQVGGGPSVYALAVGEDGDLYAGGAFTSIGGVTTSAIGRWDGTAWHALGSGLTGSTGGSNAVIDLVFDGGGNLYAGGSFESAGALTVRSVARWTGSAWEALGTGVGNGTVQGLAVGHPYLYAAGGFSDMDGNTTLDFLARWEGVVASANEPGGAPSASGFVLEPAYPNPLTTGTTLRFSAPEAQPVRVELVDALGRRVTTLYDAPVAAGQVVTVAVDARSLPAGVYVARLSGTAGHATQLLRVVH